MKYKAKKLANGNWAVCTGKNYDFWDTETPDESIAKELVIVRSLQWHHNQAEKLFQLLESDYPEKYDNYDNEKSSMGDLLC